MPTLTSDFGLEQSERAGDVPPRMVGVAHDVAFGAQADVLTFERMPERDMRDFFGQADGEADMRAVDRMPQTRVRRQRDGSSVQRFRFTGSNS